MTEEELLIIAEPLISEDRWNEKYIIDALRKLPADEREDLVCLILAPETRLVTDDRRNADIVINALKKVPEGEREAWVKDHIKKRVNEMA